jgi:hypothetical protein
MPESPSKTHAETLFEEISAIARHPKTITALTHIKAACGYLEERRIEISVQEVAVLCQQSGPALQSIHNNRRFKQYIELRRGEQHIPVRATGKQNRFHAKDPETQTIYDTLEAEIRREKKRTQNLKRALQLTGIYDLEKTLRSGHLVRVDQTEQTANLQLAAALRKLLSSEHLRKFGLERIGDRVVAPNRNGRTFIEKSDFEVLWKAVTIIPLEDEAEN